ncbi:hypothetical protein [Frateuria soli]|uniref:hypothetical protein n=1 Tax=Frateuria soli TaxID=1542730 RepID=UPI001E3BBFDD|nr:hypothetical protein [Frateuria soli]UGB39162.1 hypothetical protein LQ771_04770 [Frateuria soli]
MNERERIVNRDLNLLDEAHYGGRIARAEYRARRRNVLAALRDSHGITARKALTRTVRTVEVPDSDVLPALLERPTLPSRILLALFAAGALACAVLLGLLFFTT